MRQPRTRARAGHTLVEAVAATAIFVVGMTGMYAALGRGTDFTARASKAVINEDSARRPLATLTDALAESSIACMDTTMRFHNGVTQYDYDSNRFLIPGTGMKQCLSQICGFHTRGANLAVRAERYLCGHEYRTGTGTASATRGKIWPAELDRCPFDGSVLQPYATMDGLKFFVARDSTGTFSSTGGQGEPEWTGLVLIFPVRSDGGMCELRRYEIHVSDILQGAPDYSGDWSRWDPQSPTMIDLFDFGTDITGAAACDGSVPRSAVTSDAEFETFFVPTVEGQPTIMITKERGSPAALPDRRASLMVRLSDGFTQFAFDYVEAPGVFWSADGSFTCAPRTLVSDVTEFAVSTRESDPYHATDNPTGVREDGVVRITIATTQRLQEKGAVQWIHDVDTLVLSPRN